jgi:hypothetical protein
MSCTLLNTIRKKEGSKHITSNEINVSLLPSKREYSNVVCHITFVNAFQCLNFKAISLCYDPEFNDVALCSSSFCKENIYFGNYFYFPIQVVRIRINSPCGQLVDITPICIYNII